MHPNQPEISDLVVAYDPETLARLPVRRDEVLAEFERHSMRRALGIVSQWPHVGGILEPAFVDRVLLSSHHELVRLSEEFMQAARIRRVLVPLIAALRKSGVPGPYRIVDIGCGLGYVPRWLDARGRLGDDVELQGCDYNAAFVRFAQGLAREEGLRCRFVVANAFRLEAKATIFMSTGVIHHFRGDALAQFLASQAREEAWAFVHADIKPSYLAPLGAWIFHQARMREPLARHDGVLSALRAHSGSVLSGTAARVCPGYTVAMWDGERQLVPILEVMQMLVGVRDELAGAFREELGPLWSHLQAGGQ